jgi:hypothetical protein
MDKMRNRSTNNQMRLNRVQNSTDDVPSIVKETNTNTNSVIQIETSKAVFVESLVEICTVACVATGTRIYTVSCKLLNIYIEVLYLEECFF